MRKILIILPFLLSGCFNAYQPSLAHSAINKEKYEIDRQTCIAEAKQRIRNASNDNIGTDAAIGAIPIIAVVIGTTRNDDYTKSGYTMVDDCMKQRGYALAN